jgi:hypothetical protein
MSLTEEQRLRKNAWARNKVATCPVAKAKSLAKSKEYRAANRDRLIKQKREYGGSIPGIFGVLKQNAKTRDIPFHITLEDITQLLTQSGMKCALTGIQLSLMVGDPNKASVDRIDSHQGYTLGNLQVISARVNMAKRDLPQEAFITIANLIARRYPRALP